VSHRLIERFEFNERGVDQERAESRNGNDRKIEDRKMDLIFLSPIFLSIVCLPRNSASFISSPSDNDRKGGSGKKIWWQKNGRPIFAHDRRFFALHFFAILFPSPDDDQQDVTGFRHQRFLSWIDFSRLASRAGGERKRVHPLSGGMG
jgi:hypothetical protein